MALKFLNFYIIFFFTLIVSINVKAQCWKLMNAGRFHTIAIKQDGALWAWGRNYELQFGQGYPAVSESNIPVVSRALINWQSIVGGGYHSIGIKQDGTLWGWGDNRHGQLGNGTRYSFIAPYQVGADNNWRAISTKEFHCLAIKQDGTLWTWGRNSEGQLGDSTITERTIPTQIAKGTKWLNISAGYDHSLGIKQDGSLWAWGHNPNRELGVDFFMEFITIPRQVGTAINWKSISAGFFSSMGIKEDGTLWGWGNNVLGQLGDGTSNNIKTVPVQIGAATNWKEVAMGNFHTLAIKQNGTIWAWGNNDSGEIGDGTNIRKLVPTQVGTANDWVAISANEHYSLAIKQNGTIWAWGNNQYGQLGDGTNTNKNVPTLISHFCIPIPVKLISFTGYVTNNQNILNWSTANETNNKQFEIERSNDGINFQKIGSIQGKGNTISIHHYFFEVNNPAKGYNYYRLKQIDRNDTYSYSTIVTLQNNMSEKIQVYPTVTRNNLYISGAIQKSHYIIVNALGQIVLSGKYNYNEPIIVNGLAKGLYSIKIENSTHRFIKE